MLQLLLHIMVGLVTLTACHHARPGLHRVTTKPTAFVPARIEIAAGDSVEWVFKGTHNALFRDAPGKPSDIPSSPEGRYVRGFAEAGVFRYDCTLHPGMKGEIVVGEPARRMPQYP